MQSLSNFLLFYMINFKLNTIKQSDKVTFLDGRESTWDHLWFPGFPFKFYGEWDYVAWQINEDSGSDTNGFLNHPIEANLIPVCQREM